MQNLLIKNADVITPFTTEKSKNVFIKNGRIHSIDDSSNKTVKERLNNNTRIYDFKGKYLLPGFIDIHTHGAAGVDFFSKNLEQWVDYNYSNGVTSFLPTLLTIPIEDILNCLNNLISYMKRNDNFEGIIGINMEGPYLNPSFGVQLAVLCIEPKKDDYKKFLEIGRGHIKIMTLAPELNGSFELIKELIKNNIVVSIGHTDASMEQTINAIKSGATLATHIFNAYGYPKGLFNKYPKGKICGVREIKASDILLENDNIYAEVIADKDGIHVNPVLLRTLIKCKPIEKIILITDSMKSAGLSGGVYKLPDGRSYSFSDSDDVLFLKQYQFLSGSVLKLKDAVKNLIKHTGISFNDAIKTVTINPARLLSVDKEIGSIKEGKRANLVVMDKDFNIELSVSGGKVVYEA
ncbi:MAG: N-acetylglucosamine-6-phosphate deacetylase [Actinobacteria bacterium]|nr:N-acetylglucosamine-6-phosphate deacetylase [Actinomycetota bacterium]